MNDVVFSIITPLYNSEFHISETIESVQKQSFVCYEHIIVDDCSTDSSVLIVKKYMSFDKRIKLYKTSNPSGSPTLPRNVGIKNAKGQYIAFLDSDDIWLPNKLKNQFVYFSNSDVAIVYSNYEKIDDNGARKNRIIIAPNKVNYTELLKSNVIGCLTAVYDTTKVGKNYFENLGHEDYILWLYILKKGYIAQNTNTVEALYRVRKDSLSSNKKRALRWQWNIYVNVENINIIKSIYYFIHYLFYACLKAIK